MPNKIYLYNTLNKEKELFTPIYKNKVLIYSCGPTVYHYAHLGNLRAYIFVDILNNTLKLANYEVKHQINLTDVGHLVTDADNGEDKMEKGARREGKSVYDIAEYYTKEFFKDLENLNIDKNKFIWTKATDYINEDINMIKILENRGYTYKIKDGIYFDTAKFKNYGELARLDIEGLQKGIRVDDINNEKKNKTDFALWKFSPKNEVRQMEWDSPWGIGFPGWHIECSSMSRAILGTHLDIHTGGIDHIPIHHTNEIAQSECSLDPYDDGKFVNYWMHVNFLNADKGKMSKSSGEFLRLQTLLDKNYDPIAYKYLLLMTHYRKELKFSYEALDAASNAYQKLKKKIQNLLVENTKVTIELNAQATKLKNKFILAMYDDLNTSEALATLWNTLNDKEITNPEKITLLDYFDKYLNLKLFKI